MKIRAVVVRFVGTDGRRCSVTTDRYGTNAPTGYTTDEQLQRQAVSNALGALVANDSYGSEWAQSATMNTHNVPMHH